MATGKIPGLNLLSPQNNNSSTSASSNSLGNGIAEQVLTATGVLPKNANNIIGALTGNSQDLKQVGNTVLGKLTGANSSTITSVEGALHGNKADQKAIAGKIVGSIEKSLISAFKKNNSPTSTSTSVSSPANAKGSPLSKLLSRNDPFFSFDWYIVLPTLPVLNTPGLEKGPQLTLNNCPDFSLYAEDVSINLPHLQATNYFRNGSYLYYPTFSDVGSCSMVLYEDSDLNATKYINYWVSMVRNPQTNLYSLPDVYKKNLYVYLVDPKDSNNSPNYSSYAVGRFLVSGAWPTARGTYSLQSASSERVTLQVELAIDGVSFEAGPF